MVIWFIGGKPDCANGELGPDTLKIYEWEMVSKKKGERISYFIWNRNTDNLK
jgi:hypothetical protein